MNLGFWIPATDPSITVPLRLIWAALFVAWLFVLILLIREALRLWRNLKR